MGITQCVLGMLFLVSSGAWANQDNAINSTLPIEAADCLIVDNDKNILMVDETISGRFSIPGGSITGDETPEQAAKREVFEETGLDVIVGQQIARTYNSAIFACQLAVPVPYFIDSFKRKVLMAWSAPHFGKEVRRVLMLPDIKVVRDNYRFPEHKWRFQQWIKDVPPSQFVLAPGEDEVLTPFYQAQLSALQTLHQWKTDNPLLALFSSGSIVAGSLVSPVFFLLTLVVIRTYQGHRAALVYGAGLLAISVFVLVLTTVLVVPRPYFIDPVFGEQDTLGYTFPSTMVALITFFFCWLLINWNKEKHPKGRKRFALVGGLFVSVISAKVMLQGEHYPTDILLGALIGIGFSLGLKRVSDWRYANQKKVLTSARFWLGAFAVTGTVGIAIHHPHIVYLAACCLGVYSALLWLKAFPHYVTAVHRSDKLTFFLIAAGGILTIVLVENYVSSRYAVNWVIVALNCASVWAISVWLLVVTPRIFHQFVR